MLTNENVLDIFRDYLNEDQATEVVMTRHGYAVMLWDYAGQDWSDVECCPTPEKLFDKLLDSFVMYQEYLTVQNKEDLNDEKQAQIQAMCLPYLEKRKEAERT